ncbi:hypothetical protein B0H63DRAFT_522857 [Podospora didyma]|uniref:Uncharacterized protein n=1 Tax=Podospora didyma TaxID=330526 RepID=A0AAE0NPX5_9PEZI|nr:hypothetical protein B0H63DRAFT_522857 [Podospora didyma]
MGSAMSRCTNRNARPATGLAEIGQKMLDRQPNWLIPPSRWRTSNPDHQPVRYRTPTPYPKEDRRCLDDDLRNIAEKAAIIEGAPSTQHIEVAQPPRKQPSMQSHSPHIQFPQPTAITITWERHPRQNRFERIS